MNFDKRKLQAGLYLVGVPIGTARDITLRALDTLASADVLAAEDTRSLRKLMDIHGVPLEGRRIRALHDHSGQGQVAALVEDARTRAVAYASEAGMPLIADPGFELVRAAQAAGVAVTSAPGPSAVTTALALAGLPTDAFFFAGFLPPGQSARRNMLEGHAEIPGTLCYYESPKRLAKMLRDAAEVLGGGRTAVICRELTKRFEEVRHGTLEELADEMAGATVKGEICVLVGKGSPKISEVDVELVLKDALGQMSLRDAVDHVAAAHNMPRRKVYQAALRLTKEGQ
ncbi:MAG: 16S rRNA (cytidine(1402)-2'-O)-methyltransferase [Pseudomonadota bacterium]